MTIARLARAVGVVLSSLVLVVLVVSGATAAGGEPPHYLRSFGPDGTEGSDFGEVGAVAVDQTTGVVYVIVRQSGVLAKFDLQGKPQNFEGLGPNISGNELTGFSFPPTPGGSQVAVDPTSHRIYVTDEEGGKLLAFEANGEPALFTAGSGTGTNEISFTEADGVAVGPGGNIYVSDHIEGRVAVLAPSGELLTEFVAATPGNLAVDSAGRVYVVRLAPPSGDVRKFLPSENPVTFATTFTESSEPLDPVDSTAVAVNPATNDVFVAQSFVSNERKIAWYDETGALVTTFAGSGEEGEVRGAVGVAVHSGSSRIFVGNIGEEASRVEIFGPEEIVVGPPTVAGTSVKNVTAGSATLLGAINPNTFSTTYHFELGQADCALGPCTQIPSEEGLIGSGHAPVPVSQPVRGLQPDTTYHYRVVARNIEGVTYGPDHVFRTQANNLVFRLPDNRAWEMVSPPDKQGGRLIGVSEGSIQAAADGNGLAYLSVGPIESEPDGSKPIEVASILARRGPDGWASDDITPAHNRVVGLGAGNLGEYKMFSPDLSSALLEQRDDAPLSPESSERTPYLRELTEPSSYTPLVTGKTGFANVPPGTEFGGDLTNPEAPVSIAGASTDLRHVVLRSEVPLSVGAEPRALYEWAGGTLTPVSVLPEAEGGGIVSADSVGSGARSVRGAVSEDGGRVFWSSPGLGGLGGLYLWASETGESVRIDVPRSGASGAGPAHPVFSGATPDGSIVFFTDRQQLTEDASPSGADLYRCEIPTGSPSTGCATLTDLSAPLEGSGESAEVEGLVAAFSSDGQKLYLVARGMLDSKPNARDEEGITGEPNLYVWEEGHGVKFIAVLSEEDSPDWGSGQFANNATVEGLTAAASPNGRYFSFMSESSLTGYNNHEVVSGAPVEEVFLYDAVTEELRCVSCNPTGALPDGTKSEMFEAAITPLIDQRSLWNERLLAASVPEPTVRKTAGQSFYQPHYVNDEGRVFFNAVDALVPADSNGQWDVYQFEPLGVGDCSALSANGATAVSAGGCVSLISSGTGEQEAALLDASVNGDDVFFFTPARLSATDHDAEVDVYDARVNGITAAPEVVKECVDEGCQVGATAPIESAPGSEGFMGHGNVSPKRRCRASKEGSRHHKQHMCRHRKKKKKHHLPKKSKKSRGRQS